jgi:branched-chain amino acid transport system ATP-binding protein
MLEVTDIEVAYGAAPALRGVSVIVGAGEPVCVVGPNGAGKTTLINAIAGLHPVRSGRLSFAGRDITRLSSHRYCDAGIAIVPEGRRLFTGMTVQDNLEIGAHVARARARRAQSLESVLALFPALEAKLRSPAGSLSGGQQQMVAIGRALMARPTLLLLDEPSLGLAPAVVIEMFRAIRAINASGTAVLLVEQNVAMAMELASRAYVLEEGHIVAQGPAAQLMARPEIRQAYLGVTRQDDAVDSTRG